MGFVSFQHIHQINRPSPGGAKQLERALLKELRAMLQRSQTREFKYAVYCPRNKRGLQRFWNQSRVDKDFIYFQHEMMYQLG